ncbi:hypothetical protein [Sporisorium scitamineum]|uniref:Uncharacterized protein n=1 Tax=Sporisorium scitamineum TaxID=49012 RepID=A0A0F7RVE8_9BASI|nr:hypothetical protein [Sporisorium scitamineum]
MLPRSNACGNSLIDSTSRSGSSKIGNRYGRPRKTFQFSWTKYLYSPSLLGRQ